jgi:hypothetical protein
MIQLDPSAVVFHRHNCIPQLDQIFPLHGEQRLTDAFRLCLTWEFNDQQIGQSKSSACRDPKCSSVASIGDVPRIPERCRASQS